MLCMLKPDTSPAFEQPCASAMILAQPLMAAQVHAHLDMATVLDLLYGTPERLPACDHFHATPRQPIAWA